MARKARLNQQVLLGWPIAPGRVQSASHSNNKTESTLDAKPIHGLETGNFNLQIENQSSQIEIIHFKLKSKCTPLPASASYQTSCAPWLLRSAARTTDTHRGLPAHCSLLIAHCSLLIAHCSLLIAHCSLSFTKHQER
ncbi:MAG: hypothetical protein AAGJ35_05285, partial [Myxococcota bacterium]